MEKSIFVTDWKEDFWLPQGDDFRTFLSDFVAALPHIEVIGELSL